ncbi:hypothetical protein PVL30_005713 [Lodderomyces elongisporus]|uniref:uncharacterized protein n=1 Tax=Lodderomyces elongisporus TaxID=36914 RepID=UPI00291C9E03|nr:uncharacterized protein PVL30_005713 [Lodderomyces elongisporus]WLF81912.1 hypothetical protein PVL30_005713 [Lodderomyces elongisporus]
MQQSNNTLLSKQLHLQQPPKRPYSRSGCRECKRRKIRCPEEKPECSTCVRLGKTCSYPLAGEKVLRISRRLIKEEIENLGKSTHFLPVQYDVPKRIKQKAKVANENASLNGQQQQQPQQQQQQQQQQHSLPLHGQTSPHSHYVHHNYDNVPHPQSTIGTPQQTPSQYQYPAPAFSQQPFQQSYQQTVPVPAPASASAPASAPSSTSASAQTPTAPAPPRSSFLNIENLINNSDPVNNHFDFLNGADLSMLTTDLSNLVNEIMEFSNLQPFPEDFQFDSFNPATPSTPSTSTSVSPSASCLPTNRHHHHHHHHHHYQQHQQHQQQQRQQPSSAPALQQHIQQQQQQHHHHQATYMGEELIVNLPLHYIKLKHRHEELYLEQFYNNFAIIIEPFDAYHQRSKVLSNPARDIILKTASSEPFLLAAVLAEGAKTSFMKYKRPEDEKAYGAYLSKCLKLLEPARNAQVDDLNANIEAVLLTLLLLTAATATSTQQWRPHLTGCKELLVKISTKSRDSANMRHVSKIIMFCKYWFLSIEILAGLSTKLGGTLQTDYEINQLMSNSSDYELSVLKDMGIITEQGFNILMGYSHACISTFRDLLKLLNKHRREEAQRQQQAQHQAQQQAQQQTRPTLSPLPSQPLQQHNQYSCDAMLNLKLVSEFYKHAETVYLDSRGIIHESELHSKYTKPGLPIEEIRIGKDIYWLSWQDISHQSYVISSIIMILTRFFHIDSTNSNIKVLVDKLVSFITYLHQFSDVQQHASPFMLLMIQWPLLVTGLECRDRAQQQLLLKYFAMVGQIGASTANISVQMLRKEWELGAASENKSEGVNGDTLIY